MQGKEGGGAWEEERRNTGNDKSGLESGKEREESEGSKEGRRIRQDHLVERREGFQGGGRSVASSVERSKSDSRGGVLLRVLDLARCQGCQRQHTQRQNRLGREVGQKQLERCSVYKKSHSPFAI